jgi:predicted lysophospholipase L1 biosynthesis ABC-type transport system permease subunit
MVLRLFGKAVLMTLRERKTFIVFSLIYTALIFLTSLFLELTLSGGTGATLATYFVIIFFGTSLFLSILYAWIIVTRNRRTWATLKCIGYTNKDINKIVSGIILFTTLVGFAVVIETLFHYAAVMAYVQNVGGTVPNTLVGLIPVVITSALFIIVQLIAILIANRKVLKVRPIIALKKVGE